MRVRKLVGAMALAAVASGGPSAYASSHREAPFITKLPKVDATDFYMFRSYEANRAGFVTLIADFQPFQEPFGGPNYFMMDPDALYEIHIDNTGDAQEDLTFQFRFNNNLKDFALPIGPSGAQQNVAIPLINKGPISAPGSMPGLQNLNVEETYSLKVVRGNRRTGNAQDVADVNGGSTTFRKPVDNIGQKSIPDYAAYANAHIYSVSIPGCTTDAATQGKVFVGQRKEPFAIAVGPIFDLVNADPAIITDASKRNAGTNDLANKNITTLALEVPISCLTAAADKPIIGGWISASVRQAQVINPEATYARPARVGGAWTQVSRLGMPLVNEVVIGIKDKDRFNTSEPKNDAQFAAYVTNPTLPALLEALFGPALKAPTVFPRADLVAVFLTGVEGVNKPMGGATAEIQRLNTSIAPKPKGSQNNLGAAACFVNGALTPGNTGCDTAGFPNGRRPGDDVVDIALRVSMGYLLNSDTAAPSRGVPLHDGVLQDDAQFYDTFPYLTTPLPGATTP
ncbi:DUF4331 domain-containing protein [Archangium sp.]|uniref:DUF4331 domain-containing protein n=1 Tax=Archangium sp. TaxID=1872627 RepID=UPI00286BB2D9|nr:DUF4331 domain-containing protein [Archangium sp.]